MCVLYTCWYSKICPILGLDPSFVPLAALALTLTYRNCSFDHVSNVSSIGILIPLDQFFTVVTLFGSPQEPSGIRGSRLLRTAKVSQTFWDQVGLPAKAEKTFVSGRRRVAAAFWGMGCRWGSTGSKDR